MKHRTCNELGVCNSRPDAGCTCDAMDVSRGCAAGPNCTRYPFAPGAIERYQRQLLAAHWIGIVLDAIASLAIGVLLGALGGYGYFLAKGWL